MDPDEIARIAWDDNATAKELAEAVLAALMLEAAQATKH